MKRILAILLLAFSSAAFAIDVTITLTAPQAVRIAAACGKRMGFTNEDGTPRSCTMAEAKAWTIKLWKEVVMDSEDEDAKKARAVTPFDPT